MKRLCEESCCSNPVGILKPRYSSNVQSKVSKSHFDTRDTVTPLLCRGCMVSIQGKTIHPKWGLYNGTIGTLRYFHFSEGANPNCGDLPDYISVEFPEYIVDQYGINPDPRTIHTFQGSEAGKDKAIDRIILNCGTKRQESSSPCLFYSGLSRPTHMESYGGANDSAIYFMGENVSIDRILSLGKKRKWGTSLSCDIEFKVDTTSGKRKYSIE
eukprot:scaffold162806_cov39-Attheya_sp.AAC.1